MIFVVCFNVLFQWCALFILKSPCTYTPPPPLLGGGDNGSGLLHHN